MTFTSRPFTRVWLASKVEELASWLKSIDTSGWAFTDSTGEASAARATMALISSLVVSRLAVKVRSTSETLITGTRTARPSSLPSSSGSTRPTAAAAPVLVGIMEWVALRAR